METNFPQVTPSPIEPSNNMPFKHKVLAYVFLALFVAGLAVGVYLLNKKEGDKGTNESNGDNGLACIQVIQKARNKQTGEVKDFPTPCDVPEGWESIPPEQANWQVYTNTKHNYTLIYPSDYSIEISSDDVIYFKNQNNLDAIIGLDSVTINEKNENIWDWLQGREWPDPKPIREQFEREELGNIEAYRQTQTGTVYFSQNNRIFIISNGIGFERNTVPESIMHAFLSTFKFTN